MAELPGRIYVVFENGLHLGTFTGEDAKEAAIRLRDARMKRKLRKGSERSIVEIVKYAYVRRLSDGRLSHQQRPRRKDPR